MIVRVTEIDPICAMQACMDGYEVVSPYINGVNTGTLEGTNKELLGNTDLLVTTTGNVNVCDKFMLQALKSSAVVCNIGHFDTKLTLPLCVKTGSGMRLNLRFIKCTATKKLKTI